MADQQSAMGDDQMLKKWRESTEGLIGFVSKKYYRPCSMYRVADQLRKCNEDAFKPNMVSIGPRYKGRQELLSMEDIKWHCVMTLLNRTKRKPIEILETCMKLMLDQDAAVRATYVEEIKFDRFQLATIMLYDGCFLLEFLISASELNSTLSSDKCFYDRANMRYDPDLKSDVMKIENQIPLFIIYILFQMLFPQLDTDGSGIDRYISITQHLALSYFGYSPDSSSTSTTPNLINATHFLELIHSTIVRKNNHKIVLQVDNPVVEKSVPDELNRCANRLRAAGVTFKCNMSQMIPVDGEYELFIKFNKSDGVLEIPKLTIHSLREARWRNLIAWEQDRINSRRGAVYSDEGVFTNLAFFFNELICCESDVQLLKDMKIIDSFDDSSNHDLVGLFRSMTSGLRRGHVQYHYCDIIMNLNGYSATNVIIKYAIIVWHCLPEWFHAFQKFIWRGYNFAAALIGLLTFVQTIYAVLSYHHPKK